MCRVPVTELIIEWMNEWMNEKDDHEGCLRSNWEEVCFPLLEVLESDARSVVLSVSLFNEHFWVVTSVKGSKGEHPFLERNIYKNLKKLSSHLLATFPHYISFLWLAVSCTLLSSSLSMTAFHLSDSSITTGSRTCGKMQISFFDYDWQLTQEEREGHQCLQAT